MSIIKGTNQIVAGFGGTKRSIGEVYFSQSALATDNSGALPLFTGESIASANTIYPEFYNWVLAHTELHCTSSEYESALSTYGECAKYVIGSGSLRLPKLSNYIKMANSTEGITQKGAGLPNITGDWNSAQYVNGWSSNGAVYGIQNDSAEYNSSSQGMRAYFDASRSNPIYGSSDTVQPAHTTLYPWVVAYTAAIPASTAQAAQFQQGLSGKADTNLGNLSTAGKDLASGLGMPSNRYIDLTLGASGTTYTAPANGWLFLDKVAASGNYIQFLVRSNNKLVCYKYEYASANLPIQLLMPIGKGHICEVYYTASGKTNSYRFIYAEGAE